ncbi:MAG: sulfatase-like hydrolase/transferase [Ignavibacteriae bacterium]|nr:sulfatase-like hydrolase/transferase [Ignavibacteriota bacterium]MCB9216721.1 sulfatase-like hydrolase/transferase [Ignavibacteria bacterium]
MTKKPNIILIVTDQQRAPQLFDENMAKFDLPAYQRLRKNGIEFEYAFCNTCMCSPSRSTLFTSLYPSEHGVTQTLSFGGPYSIAQPTLDPTLPNMANLFYFAGYNVQYRGKWHLSKGNTKGDTENNLTAAEVGLFGFMGWEPPDAGEDTKPENFGGGFANHDERYIREAIEFIENYDDPRPYLLVLSLVNPHDVLAYPNGYTYGYGDEILKGPLQTPPSMAEDLLKNYKPTAQWQLLLSLNGLLGNLNNIPDGPKNYVNMYANLIRKIDHQIDQLLDLFMDKKGNPTDRFQDTVIIRTADHGEMGLAHGGLRQKAFNVYEETIRVPMIWSSPLLGVQGVKSDSMVSLVDTLPTLIGFTGIDVPSNLKLRGHDYHKVLTGETTSTQENILFTFDDIRAGATNQQNAVLAPNRIRMVRNSRWKYAVYFHEDSSYPMEYEFYDLDYVSPDLNSIECANLAYHIPDDYPDPALAERTMKEMQALLQQEIEAKLYKKNWNPDWPDSLPTPNPNMVGN